MSLSFQILGTGSFVPDKVVTNLDLAARFNTSDDWIRAKTGIHERRHATPGEGPSDLALRASTLALEQANIPAQQLDAIVFSTTTPEYLAPGSGHLLGKLLNCPGTPVFEVRQTSPGFLFALELTDGLIKTGRYKTVLVVCSEVFSNRLDFTDRGRLMSVIFGDGAGAVVARATDGFSGLVDCILHSDGHNFEKLMHAGVTELKQVELSPEKISAQNLYPQMDGPFVFQKSVDSMVSTIKALLARNQITFDDVDYLLTHQANLRIVETVGQKLGIAPHKVPTNIARFGNTSSASIPLLLDELNRQGKLKRGQKIILTSFGSGFCWGAGLLVW